MSTETPPAAMGIMSTTTLTASLLTKINQEHKACIQAVGKALEHAMRCGDLLIQAKGECKHGGWQPWVEEHFDGNARTARSYMQLADNRDVLESKRRDSAVLSIDGALKMLAAPQEDEPELDAEALIESARNHLKKGWNWREKLTFTKQKSP
jgi:hypothetical protein